MNSIWSAIRKYKIMVLTFSVQLLLMALFHFCVLSLIQQWLSTNADQQSLFFWIVLFCVSIPLLSLGILSSTFLALVGGYFLAWQSLAFYMPCYILSAYLGYEIVNFIDQGKTIHSLASSQKIKNVVRFLSKHPFLTIFFLRFSPVISFGQLTALCAFLKLKISTYLLASALGMIPRTLLAIGCGIYIQTQHFTLSEYQLPGFYTPFVILLLVISLGGIIYMIRRSISSTKSIS